MKTPFLPAVTGMAALFLVGCAALNSDQSRTGDLSSAKPVLPRLPAGVTELKFNEFYVTPVGPLGLAVTEKLASLDGHRVRLLGYMVRQEHGVPGQFLLTALPVQLHDHDSGLADDLPPAVVHVSVPTCRDQQVAYAPGLMLLTGTLSVGHREENDGRMSVVRLALDPPGRGAESIATTTGKGAGLTRFEAAAGH